MKRRGKMRLLRGIISCCFTGLIFSGCGFLKCPGKLLLLKSLRDNQVDIQRYIERQEKLFEVLVKDIKTSRLSTGLPSSIIIKKYGEPVLIRENKEECPSCRVFLYRRPVDYFSSDKVYLYFDSKDELSSWEYRPFTG